MRICLLLGCFAAASLYAQPAIIPQPDSVQWLSGQFNITATTYLLANDFPAFQDAVAFRDLSLLWHKLPLKTATKPIPQAKAIEVSTDSTMTAESYALTVTPDKIQIVGGPDGGVFYGLVTLLQCIQGNQEAGFTVPAVSIRDQPQFSWRGMHLDVSRHFFSVDEVKQYIDYLGLYKMNTFHWHLTDDQGWRIEIKKYPKLTEVGSMRQGSMVGHYRDQRFDTIPYGGYYTQEEIREVVAYAAKRHIQVIPEIEMPGHALAALAAYPEYSCSGGPFEVGLAWGVYEDVFCTREETFVFLEGILEEVISLFPSPVIHIGGDEVPKTRWKNCPHCQQRMQNENLHNEAELQSYFIRRVEAYLNARGKIIIGWDEILEGGLAPNAMVMSWRGTEGGLAAANQNHQVVMSPNNDCYFDHYQADPAGEPLAIGGLTTLQDVYAYEPIPAALPDNKHQYILGAQGNVWTEYIPNFDQVEYMSMPRMMALAEVLWTYPSNRTYPEFKQRLEQHLPLLDNARVNYSRSFQKP